MLRLLLQAGLGMATLNVGRRIGALKRMAVFFAIAGVIALAGLGALTAALVIYLQPRLGAAGAAAAVGGGLCVLAGLIGWIGTLRAKPKPPTPIFDRVSAELGAAGSALSASRRRARAAAASAVAEGEEALDDGVPAPPRRRRKTVLNMVLIATLAGVVLGRRL